jgi:serine/threonine protein kinase
MSKSDSGAHEDKMLKQSESTDQFEQAAEPSLRLNSISSDRIATGSDGTVSTTGDTNQAVPGSIIGRVYRLEAQIGTGGMGSVYRAVHLMTGQNVALKLLHSQRLDENSILRFQQESTAVSKLDHPHIAAAHYFDVTENGVPFLAMDLVEGTSLSSLLDQQKRLPWQRAVEVAMQICSALQHAHERGVIHRDLKPSNVLLKMEDGADFVKIVDFGIAKVSVDDMKNYTLTETGAVLGTPLYMSPEQCRGLKLDSRSDIYSLGCVLYEMLTGQPPHVGQSPLDTIFKHINERAKPIFSDPSSTLPPGPAALASIVSRALERDPQKRYQTMDELRQDLSQVLQHQPGQHLRLKARQSHSRKAVVLVLFVVAVCGFVISHVYRLAHWGDHVDKAATIPWQVISAEEPADSYLSLYQKMQQVEKEASSILKDPEPAKASAMANQLISIARQVSEHNQADADNACILAQVTC